MPLGGYRLVGWASVACCLAAAVLACTLPEPRRRAAEGGEAPRPGNASRKVWRGSWRDVWRNVWRKLWRDAWRDVWRKLWRDAWRDAWRQVRGDRAVRAAVLVLAGVSGLDSGEEYFGLLLHAWHVSVAAIPVVALAIPLAGAAGAAWAGRTSRGSAAYPLVCAAMLLAAAQAWGRPGAVVLVAAAYAAYRVAIVGAQVRLQRCVDSSARATVTSVAAVLEEGPVLAVYVAWSAFGLAGLCVLMLAVASGAVALYRRGERIMAT
jgi:hypothetical protein